MTTTPPNPHKGNSPKESIGVWWTPGARKVVWVLIVAALAAAGLFGPGLVLEFVKATTVSSLSPVPTFVIYGTTWTGFSL